MARPRQPTHIVGARIFADSDSDHRCIIVGRGAALPNRSSPTFSQTFYRKVAYARIYCVFHPYPSSAYFEYACGGCGCQALYLRASSAFRCEVGEKVGLGAQMARVEGVEISDPVRSALIDLEQSLALGGREVVRRLLAPPRPAASPTKPKPCFDVSAMTTLLDGDQVAIRRKVRSLISRPEFAYLYGVSTNEYRERVLERVQILADAGIGSLSFPVDVGGSGDMAAFVAAFETSAYGDLSVLIKIGVQFGLFGGSILQLGTERHHKTYLPRVGTLDLPGCFAMTETGHGSNVYDLETVAKYDSDSDEFSINTPNKSARKDYIGNAALHGRLAAVFAQLEVKGQNQGVHALLVPIRDGDGNPCKGVGIEDCGEKLGLNGVDNGRIWFDDVRVPRENLLDRFGRVSADGDYESPIASPAKRFFTMLGVVSLARKESLRLLCSTIGPTKDV